MKKSNSHVTAKSGRLQLLHLQSNGDRQTDQLTDQPTNEVSYRGACMRLEMMFLGGCKRLYKRLHPLDLLLVCQLVGPHIALPEESMRQVRVLLLFLHFNVSGLFDSLVRSTTDLHEHWKASIRRVSDFVSTSKLRNAASSHAAGWCRKAVGRCRTYGVALTNFRLVNHLKNG
jgi:hypothetical protein